MKFFTARHVACISSIRARSRSFLAYANMLAFGWKIYYGEKMGLTFHTFMKWIETVHVHILDRESYFSFAREMLIKKNKEEKTFIACLFGLLWIVDC